MGSLTRNAFSTANTEYHSNGGSSEEAIFSWTSGESLKDLGAGPFPGINLLYAISGTILG